MAKYRLRIANGSVDGVPMILRIHGRSRLEVGAVIRWKMLDKGAKWQLGRITSQRDNQYFVISTDIAATSILQDNHRSSHPDANNTPAELPPGVTISSSIRRDTLRSREDS